MHTEGDNPVNKIEMEKRSHTTQAHFPSALQDYSFPITRTCTAHYLKRPCKVLMYVMYRAEPIPVFNLRFCTNHFFQTIHN